MYYLYVSFAGLEMEHLDENSGNADLACRRDTGYRYNVVAFIKT